MRTKHLLNFQWKRSVSHSRPYITRVDLSRVLHRNPLNLNHRVSTARVAQYRGGCIKFDECLPREAPKRALSLTFSLSLARAFSHFYFYPPRRGGARVERLEEAISIKKKERRRKKKNDGGGSVAEGGVSMS